MPLRMGEDAEAGLRFYTGNACGSADAPNDSHLIKNGKVRSFHYR